MKLYSVPTAVVLLAMSTLTAGAQNVSTNPDTPATLKTNVIVGQMNQGDGKSFDNYYTFQAKPGTTRVRVTLRAGTDAGDVEVGLNDPDGGKISPASCTGTCNYDNVIASGQGDATTTGAFTFDSGKTIVMHVHGSAGYYHNVPHPTYRITLDGDVGLDKTARPLTIDNH